MSPELFEKFDLLFASDIRYRQDGGDEEFADLVDTLSSFLSGDLDEKPTRSEERVLRAILHEAEIAYFISTEAMEAAIVDAWGSWKLLREQITKEAQPSTDLDSGPKWQSFKDRATAASHLKIHRGTVTKWLKKEEPFARADEGKRVSIDMEAPEIKKHLG